MDAKISDITGKFLKEFENRITFDGRKRGDASVLQVISEVKDNSVDFILFDGENASILSIPTPFIRRGVYLLKIGSVERVISKYYNRLEDKELDYADIVYNTLLGDITPYLTSKNYRGVINSIKHIRFTNERGNFLRGVHNIQRILNGIINQLPLYSTDMNAYITNNRLTIIDDAFDAITNPADKHEYQVEKNKKFFSRGWSSLGLADGVLADNNYILAVDLRKSVPFGLTSHNPGRNLYSTLNMRGDETPLVMSQTMKDLQNMGITRTGWNLFTVFVDIPDVYEDQLMVDISHKDKYIDYPRKIRVFGEIQVSIGDTIYKGDTISFNEDGELKRLNIPCDSAFVDDITTEEMVIGGESYMASIVHLTCRRFLKDGAKLTNMAANKGVIRLRDLGYAIDPSTGRKRKIDVIVSGKAVLKRKNYTQILEAVLNTANEEKEIVIPDDIGTSENKLVKALEHLGHRSDGTWKCHTYAGEFDCVCGTVFWGVTHDADDTLWDHHQTWKEDGSGLRRAGLKLSTIEFRAIQTRFGKDSAIEKEILSYAQGGDELEEHLKILDSKCGVENEAYKILSCSDLNPVNVKETFIAETDLKGTFLDENVHPKGFVLQLPIKYQIMIDKDHNTLYEGFPCEDINSIDDVEVFKKITIDKIYIPCYNVRKCWRHEVGKYGYSNLGRAINDILISCQKYDDGGFDQLSDIYRTVCAYYKQAADDIGSKSGLLSILGMSVRYPNSAKAVATLSNDIPRDTVEIHRNMAKSLKVKSGDVVLIERFPCLGFVSLRPQYVKVTDDESCRYTIRASGNSLGSLTLDFDGDVLFIASLHSEEAKQELKIEMLQPNKICDKYIQRFNENMGVPRFKEMSLQDYKISQFDALTEESHAEIVAKASGVKNYTGPVIALAYNLLRIAEASDIKHDQEFDCALEVFMNTVANSVFKQKHGIKSLHQVVTDAVCLTDIETLVQEGFDRRISEVLCNTIREKAKSLGVDDLKGHHEAHLERGRSNIITYIVRNTNKLYFASRSKLDATRSRDLIRNYDTVDLPSELFNKTSKQRACLDSDIKNKETVEMATKLVNILLPEQPEEDNKFFTIKV